MLMRNIRTKRNLRVKMANKKVAKQKYIRATGRRKTATAVIKLVEGKQSEQPITVNGQPIDEYWPGEVSKTVWQAPFRRTNTLNVYTGSVVVRGSGEKGQLGAFVHAVARALSKANEEKFRPILKKRGFLTRDSRMKERRKPGLAQSARAKKQSPKR